MCAGTLSGTTGWVKGDVGGLAHRRVECGGESAPAEVRREQGGGKTVVAAEHRHLGPDRGVKRSDHREGGPLLASAEEDAGPAALSVSWARWRARAAGDAV
jgi:hypothetical protein